MKNYISIAFKKNFYSTEIKNNFQDIKRYKYPIYRINV